MSTVKYKEIFKIDKENKFMSKFDGNTGFYVRTGVLKYMNNIESDTGIDPFMTSFPELIDVGIMETCVCSGKCKVDCYQKACDRNGKNMSLEDYKCIICLL